MLDQAALRPRFEALTALLRAHHGLWHPRPFTALPPPWAAELPAAAAGIEAGRAPEDLPGLAEPLAQARALSRVGPFPAAEGSAAPRVLADARVPGRKRAQIEAFLAATLARLPDRPRWLDWCAGKGHLGRSLAAATGAPVRLLEHDPALCATGAALARRARLPRGAPPLALEWLCADALDPASARHAADHAVVALHACGALHLALVDHAAVTAGLAFAPCCYARGAGAAYAPCSAAGRASELPLDAHDLSLPGREAVVATARDGRLRDQSRAWRLGFDLLQRAVTGTDRYQPVPPFPPAWLHLDFAAFCARCAAAIELALPAGLDPAPLEALGAARLAQVARYEAVRRPFAAALEVWLVLDRALALAEAGLTVEVGRFCPRAVTPRNLLVIARPARAQRFLVS